VNKLKTFRKNAEKQIDRDFYTRVTFMMNNKRLPSIVALSICLELVIAPIPAMAGPNTMKTISDSLNLGMQAYGTFRGQGQQQMPPHVATDMANFQKQQSPAADKHFTLQNMEKIPGLMEYVAKKNQDAARSGGKAINPASLNCATLPTTLTVPDNEVCRNGKVNDLAGDPKMQADEAFAYYNQYKNVETVYKNFTVKSNVGGQGFGEGCMEDAMAVLKGFFAYRVEQLDTVMAEMEAATANFEKQSEMDLKSIRESSAILNGEESKFSAEFSNTDVFDYGKRFEDPACNSLMSKDDVDSFGKKSGGLLAIEDKLKKDLNVTPAGSKYSAESYIKNHADVVSDIKKMADKVAEQSTLNFGQISSGQEGYAAFLSGLNGDVTSESGAHQGLNKALFSDLQTKFTKQRNALKDEESLIMSELGGSGSAAGRLLSKIDNDSTFDAEVGSLENKIKGECVNKAGIDTALSRIYDPNLSSAANKHSSELIKKKLATILSDVTISPEKKLAELQALGDSRYEMRMDADYETQEVKADGSILKKKVSAAGRVSPSSFFKDVIKNCETQFQVNKLGNKLSGKEAIKRLRTLKKDYQKASRDHEKDIKNEIVKKMIDCNGNGAVASSSTVASCTPEKLNMASPGFCAKAAFSCSTNMKKCTEKAQKFVSDIKGDRLKRTNNFNNNVEQNRKQLVGMFDGALTKYLKEAESLRGMFGAGFTTPTGIERDVKGGAQFDQKFLQKPDALEITNPKVYLEMVKENIGKLKSAVAEQQEAIVGSGGPLVKHMAETKKNHDEVTKKSGQLANKCLAAYDSYKDMLRAQKEGYDKSQGELGEKSAKFCGRYDDIMVSNPIPGCDDGYAEVSDAMILAATKAGNAGTAEEARRMRAEMAETCAKPGNQRDKDGKSAVSAADVCVKARNDEPLQKALASLATDKSGWDAVCANVRGTSQKLCPFTEVENASGKISKSYDCTSLKESVVAEYNGLYGSGALVANSDDNNSHASGVSNSFCNASNNSGPFNTKGTPGISGPGFPGLVNPLSGTRQ
jgi:hypothetical protein